MPDQIYIRIDNRNIGPLASDELKQYPISADTPVWYPGLQAWTKLEAVPELAVLLQPVPPPFVDETVGLQSPPLPPDPEPNPAPLNVPEDPVVSPDDQDEKQGFWLQYKTPLLIGGGLLLLIALLVFLLGYERPTTTRKASKPETEEHSETEVTSGTDRRAQEEERILIDAAAEEKARVEAQTAKNKQYRNNWTSYITASRSSYNTGGLGGVSGLQIGLVNKTEYVLASVVVAVDYITVNGYHHKREYVTFENLAPRSQQVLDAPVSDRGTRVDYEIYTIYAPAFMFCYDVNLPRGLQNSEDPWKCNEQQHQFRNNY